MGVSAPHNHWIVLAAAGLQAACVKPYEPPVDEGSTNCVPALGACEPDDDVGQSEDASGTESDTVGEATPAAAGECIGNYNQNLTGYRHQCEGTVDFSIEFDIPFIAGTENCEFMESLIPDHQLCEESHIFGGEPYGQANVASCCGPWNEDPELEDVYTSFCAVDLANQLCLTLVDRLKYHLDNNHFAGSEDQASNLIKEVAGDIGGCTNQFIEHDSDLDPGHLDSFYQLHNSDSWPSFVDFKITVDIGDITGFSLPADPVDWLACSGMQGNDGYTFPKPQGSVSGSPDATILASAMTVEIHGPTVMGDPVSGSEPIGSLASQCVAPWCSTASFVMGVGEWAIEGMTLFASSDVTLSNALGSYDLTGVRIVLADTALGYELTGSRTHIIDADDAFFWVVGGAADDPSSIERFLVSNSTPIMAKLDSRTWSLAPFDLEYIDLNGGVWTIEIPSATWE